MLSSQMRLEDLMPDSVTIMGLTQMVSGMKDCRLLSAVHCLGIKCGLENDVSVANTWIAGYAKCDDFSSAEKVFYGIDSDSLTIVSWNAIISGCSYFEDSMKSAEIYKNMLYAGFKPDLSTILNMLSSFSQPKSLFHGMLIHAHGIKIGCVNDVALLNTIVSMYSKCGDIVAARHLFDFMDVRSLVSWTAMIGGYSKSGDLDEVLSLFRAMVKAGEQPDMVTVIHLISVCAKVGALEVGKWTADYTISQGFGKNLMVCNALLDMYAKCGTMEDAEELFSTMNEKSIVSWTIMIAGYALNGNFQASVNLLDQMLIVGLQPNDITFLAVLQACIHGGFLEEGCIFFDKMVKIYRLKPGIDHYSCLIDLLGRQGKLEEALNIVQNMPMKPDAGIWGTLFSACKIHQNLEMAEIAGYHLLQLEPQDAVVCVEMANVYAAANEWKEFANVRRNMKNKQMSKIPGQSVVYVDGKCHSFTVEDRSHGRSSEIFETLDCLILQLKDEEVEDDLLNFLGESLSPWY